MVYILLLIIVIAVSIVLLSLIFIKVKDKIGKSFLAGIVILGMLVGSVYSLGSASQYLSNKKIDVPSIILKNPPTIEVKEDISLTNIGFKAIIHAVDNYSYVSYEINLANGDKETIKTINGSISSLTKGVDYERTHSINITEIFNFKYYNYKITEYK